MSLYLQARVVCRADLVRFLMGPGQGPPSIVVQVAAAPGAALTAEQQLQAFIEPEGLRVDLLRYLQCLLKVCPGSPCRGCQHWLRSAGHVLPDVAPGIRLAAAHLDVDAVGRRPYLLRRGGYSSIRQGLRELAYDIQGMLALGGVATRASPDLSHL
jgi:hypothetical protein